MAPSNGLRPLPDPLWVGMRAVVYMAAFVLGFGLIAMTVDQLDEGIGFGLPAWVVVPGAVMMALGGILVGLCGLVFIVRGRGTPAPFDAPRVFVASGPYRYVRNPMYLGGLSMLVGFGLVLRSGSVLVFAGLVALIAHAFVAWYEEPTLARLFGESYRMYRAQVHRWRPSVPGVNAKREH